MTLRISLSSDASTIHMAGNRIGELALTTGLLANVHLYFQRRNRWSCRHQQPHQQECQDSNDQQLHW